MSMKKKSTPFFLLTVLVCLTVFELDGYQASTLCICIAGLLWAVARRPNTVIPPVAFIAVAYALGFALPVLWPGLYVTLWARVSPSALEYGMLWAVRGFGAFALAYALVEHLGKRGRTPTPLGEASVRARMRYTIYVLKCVGWLAMLSWFASVMIFGIALTFIEGSVVTAESDAGFLLQALTLLSSLRYPFFFGFILFHFQKQRDKRLSFLFVVLLLISVIEIIAIGSKGSIIRVIVVVLLASAFHPLRLNPKQVIAGALALIVVYGAFAVITEYRSIMRDELLAGRDVFSFSVQSESFVNAVDGSLPFSDSATDRRTQVTPEDIFGRFGSGIYSFANLLEFTGRQAPYEHAWGSFLVPVYSIVPRALVPGKPVFFGSGRNAQEYYGWSYGGISALPPYLHHI